MGAGVSQKTMNRYYYNRLKKIQAELIAAGVPTLYRKYQLFPDLTGITNLVEGFNISFRTLRASNGETAGLLRVVIDHALTGRETYEHLNGMDGIKRLKQLFKPIHTPSNQEISDGVIRSLQEDSGCNRR